MVFDRDAALQHESAVLEHLRRSLLDATGHRQRPVVFTGVTFTGSYPSTMAHFAFRSDRHPDQDQRWKANLWLEDGEPATYGRRVSFGGALPDVTWHSDELLYGFNDNWVDE